jgi:type I restriction enzyme, S subunit
MPIFGSMVPPSSDRGEWLSLRVANIQDWKLDLSDQRFIDLPSNLIQRHSVSDGDLLMARAIATQEHLGKSIVVHPGKHRWAFDSHLMRLRFDQSKVFPEFIHSLLRTPGGRSLFLGVTRRSAVQFNVNTKEIASLKIPVPPIPAQRDFVQLSKSKDQLALQNFKSLSELDSLFASLQHRAFRGEL